MVKVYLDGQIVENVQYVSSAQGTVSVYKRDKNGQFVVKDGLIQVETKHGDVRVEPGLSPQMHTR